MADAGCFVTRVTFYVMRWPPHPAWSGGVLVTRLVRRRLRYAVMSETPANPIPHQAGWYMHPDGSQERFWDGTAWTAAHRPKITPSSSGPLAPFHGPAIASMVLGIVSIVFWYFGIITGLIGLVMGAKSLKHLQPRGTKRGRGMAIAGIVCSIVALALWTLLLLVIIVASANSN
jgi:hypothetical protein